MSTTTPEAQHYIHHLLAARATLERFETVEAKSFQRSLADLIVEIMANEYFADNVQRDYLHLVLRDTLHHANDVFDFFEEWGGDYVHGGKLKEVA